jgi:hypothetical protein
MAPKQFLAKIERRLILEDFIFLISTERERAGKVAKLKINNRDIVSFFQRQIGIPIAEILEIKTVTLSKMISMGGESCLWGLPVLALFSLAGEEKKKDIFSFFLKLQKSFNFQYVVF